MRKIPAQRPNMVAKAYRRWLRTRASAANDAGDDDTDDDVATE